MTSHTKTAGEVRGKVILGDSSFLTGNLNASILIIEEGASFDGVCSMGKEMQSDNNAN